ALCEQGEVGHGLLWMARSLELAEEARSEDLVRPIRINLADWRGQLARPLRLPRLRHPAPILGLAFRRRGRVLVSVGKDGVVRIWDTVAGKEIEPSLDLEGDPPVDRLEHARFGPEESGLLITVDNTGRAAVWDVDHRRRLASPPAGSPPPSLRDSGFSDTQNTLGCSKNIMSHCCKMTASPLIEGSPGQRRRRDTAWALSPDGRTLVTAGRDRRVLRWEVATGGRLEPELHLDSPVAAIA